VHEIFFSWNIRGEAGKIVGSTAEALITFELMSVGYKFIFQ
jgi:hypothetical protein